MLSTSFLGLFPLNLAFPAPLKFKGISPENEVDMLCLMTELARGMGLFPV